MTTDVTENTTPSLVILKENRFPLFSLVLVILAFCLTAYMAYLNSEITKVAGAQLIRSQQLQEMAQSKFMDQYAKFLQQQAKLARFENSFEIRQKHYADFMAGLSDAWYSVNKKDRAGLDAALNKLAKAYYGLEPFLESGGRNYLKKRIAIFHNLAKQLSAGPRERNKITLEDKSTMNRMIEDFQNFLYPLLFDPAVDDREEAEDEANR